MACTMLAVITVYNRTLTDPGLNPGEGSARFKPIQDGRCVWPPWVKLRVLGRSVKSSHGVLELRAELLLGAPVVPKLAKR